MHRNYHKFMHRVIMFSRPEKISVKNSASRCVKNVVQLEMNYKIGMAVKTMRLSRVSYWSLCYFIKRKKGHILKCENNHISSAIRITIFYTSQGCKQSYVLTYCHRLIIIG